MVVDWPAESPDLSPIEVLWAILKKVVRRRQPQTIEDTKGALVACLTLIPQISIDRLREGFQARLQLWLADEDNSVSHQLWRISEHKALKAVLAATDRFLPSLNKRPPMNGESALR
jgi:hypothetical protein